MSHSQLNLFTMEIAEIIESLKELQILTEDDFDILNDLCEEIEQNVEGNKAIKPLLGILESHPYVDFGLPGNIVHTLESFFRKGYEDELVNSLQRTPTLHTVWMLNRVINGVEKKERKKYIDILINIVNKKELDEEIIELAREFLDHQNEE